MFSVGRWLTDGFVTLDVRETTPSSWIWWKCSGRFHSRGAVPLSSVLIKNNFGKDFAIGCIRRARVAARRRCIRSSQSVCFHTLFCFGISGLLSAKVATPARLPERRLWCEISEAAQSFSSIVSSINGFSLRAVMLETSGSIAGHWSIPAAWAGCQNGETARRGLLEVVMEMDSGRCSQTHLSIIAVSIVIRIQKHEMHMTKISPKFSFRSVLFFLGNSPAS